MPIADSDPRDYFTPDEIQKLHECFCQADVDGGQSIGLDELHLAFKKTGRNLSKQTLRELLKTVDMNENGEIEFEEFLLLEIMVSQSKPNVNLIKHQDFLPDKTTSALYGFFLREDPQNEGCISCDSVVRIVQGLSPEVKREQVEEVFKQADVHSSGKIDFSKLCCLYVVVNDTRRKCNYREFLSREQVLKFRKIFAAAANAKGTCSFSDLERLLRRLGLSLKKQQLAYLIRNFDADQSGDIDFEEFCIMMLRVKGMRQKSKINPETCKCGDLFWHENFTIKELLNSGFSIPHFREVGIPVGVVMKENICSVLDLRRAGYTPSELRRGGLGPAELRASGYSLAALRVAGFSEPVLKSADRDIKAKLVQGDMSALPQVRPISRGCPVRGAVLSNAGNAAVVSPSWQLPPRPMTQMIREHTDWRPRLTSAASPAPA